MSQSQIHKTKYHSWCTGRIAKGCSLCVKGRKLVLFITGICAQKCFYCPISEKKFGIDITYANEWQISNPENPIELFREAQITEAKGAGITGGDPLAKIERCCKYISQLKKKFGKSFHIHLYTPLKLVTKEKLTKLYNAGLDEIRFHPDLDDNTLWQRINLAKKFSWDIGVEIPAIPGYEQKTKKLIDYLIDKIDFINLNELELSDTKIPHYELSTRRFMQKDSISYGVKGSKEMALRMLRYAKSKGLNAYFCTAKLKDSVQVGERIKLRAKHSALSFDTITKEGLLIRGCVYIHELKPSSGYREQLKQANKKTVIKKLANTKAMLNRELSISKESLVIDEKKLRIILPAKILREKSDAIKSLGLIPAIVEEYPTDDAIEIDVEFL